MVTDTCNLGCLGCVTHAQFGRLGDGAINKDFAIDAIKTFFRSNYFKIPYLFFSGRGEPTQRIDIIEEIVHESRKILGNPYIGIQTNGVFDDVTRKRISEISDLVWISVDAQPKLNDILRPMRQGKSSEYITKNTHAFLKSGTPVRWRSTIYPMNSSAEEQKALVDYAKECGVDIVVCEPANVSPSLQKTRENIYLVDIAKFIDGFTEANNYASAQGIIYVTGLMEEAQKLHDTGARKRCSECFAIDPKTSQPRSATLTTDNRMAGCYLGYEENSIMKSLTFGRWQNGRLVIDDQRLRDLGQAYEKDNCCFGRSLLGQSKIDSQLLEKLRIKAKYPLETPYHA